MTSVYLNGDFLPMSEARISPMDRGFLFGDGIYEVIPSYSGRLVGFGPHMQRMRDGLAELEIRTNMDEAAWRDIVETLVQQNGSGNLGVYLHVSRGADSKRHHAYPTSVDATCFGFTFEIPPPPVADKQRVTPYRVSTAEDLRWKRCHIKSTALLGNVMHYQQGHAAGAQETILYNSDGEVTEAAACNVFVVRGGVVATPPLDHQKLPGITRLMLLDILRRHSDIPVEERVVTVSELLQADEVWITSSSKEIAPVTMIDGKPVGAGEVGDVWAAAQGLFAAHRYDY
ncbi:D-amino acid aminotransferase [Chromatocurvus halotolerans]|uniref:Aminodeoxychorismate lyase n=1 Tax=Chromatocurvus halotolerans TaxID=1132028 RepID=A0A4R2KZ10_9GAMM|nr:D-amino acid aminotransferase [Chromatocurvus halotolerans]TCO78412.1 D-alanine transaminase [Chromatocurvus halotolerans]